jgi:acetolactate synthase-1/2/3 large subunit
MNAAVSMLRTAAAAEVDVCFANPGTTEMAFVAALDRVPAIRPVLCLFEGVCTGAADGYGRMRGAPALTLLHLGPGFANGIANLHNARRAASPVVNLIGDHMSWHLEHDAPLTSDIESLARPVSAWLRTVGSAKDAPAQIAEAIAAAGGAPGSVATLVVPADFQIAESGGPANRVSVPAPTRPEPSEVETAAALLRGAEPPTLLLGGTALSARGVAAAGRVAAATGARLVAETFASRWERGRGTPAIERLPYLPEQASQFLAAESGLLLAGARSPVAFFGYPGVPSLIAPDRPRHSLARPEQDAAGALEDLADALDARTPAAADEPAAPPAPGPGPLDALTVGRLIAANLPEGAIVVDEAATSGLGLYAAATHAPPHTVLALTGGAIGQGMPCATGAAIACPDRKVISFQADGSAAYTLQALWTQAREGLDIVTLLCSNRAYRILQIEFGRAGIAEPGPAAQALTTLDAPEIDWVKLALGFGVPALRVDTSEALARALPRAIAEPGPRLIEIIL